MSKILINITTTTNFNWDTLLQPGDCLNEKKKKNNIN